MSSFVIVFSNIHLIQAPIYPFLEMVACSELWEGWITPFDCQLGMDPKWGSFFLLHSSS